MRDAILLGALLAGVVLFMFLRDLRLMLVTALLLPATLGAACSILSVLGMSFNIMTLGGMAAAVGLVVDDTIVMLEHLTRRFQDARRGEGRARPSAGGGRDGPTADRLQPLDHRHLHSAGFSRGRDRRILSRPGRDNGRSPDNFPVVRLVDRSAPGARLAAREGCRRRRAGPTP